MNCLYRSKVPLFLIEQLIAILVFALCALVCVRILVSSYIMANDSSDMSQALRIAESAAESFKASGGNAEAAAQILTGSITPVEHCGGGTIAVYYSKEWQICERELAAYRIRFTYLNPVDVSSSLVCSNLAVEKMTGEEIIALTVAAGRTAG